MTTKTRVLCSALALMTLGFACGRSESPAPAASATPSSQAWPLTLEDATPPGVGEGLAPQLTASRKSVILSWIERTDDTSTLKFSERTGTSWTAPRTIASGNGWFVSPADTPTVLRLTNGTLVANWFVTTREEIEAYNTLLSHSADDGRTWSRPFTPHKDTSETQHGFATPLETADGGLGLVWLDGRDMANNTTDPEGGVMTLRYTSFDQAWKQSPDVEVDRRVCECCQTAAVSTSDGIVTAFRDRSDTEVRDIKTSRLENGTWTAPQVVHADNWEVDSCPVNGPALSARGRALAASWFNFKGDEGHAFGAFSPDAGRTWSAPIRLDEKESVGRVDIEMLDDGSAAAAWVEFTDSRMRFMVRRIGADGSRSAPVVIAGAAAGRVTGYPRMVRRDNELIFTWSEGTDEVGRTVTRAAVAAIPR